MMKQLVVLVLCCVAYSSAVRYAYVNTGALCSSTVPAAPGTGWVYCVESSMYVRTDCGIQIY